MSTIKKVTMKSSVAEIKEFLSATSKNVAKKDKNLFERMKYTSNALAKGEKVAKKDLFDLANDVMSLLAMPASAETKKDTKNDTKKTSKKLEAKPKSENALKKSGTTKENTKQSKSSDKKTEESKVQMGEYVVSLPDTIERDGNKYEIAKDIKSIKDLYKAFEKGEQFVFAYVWTKRMLMQFDYFPGIVDQPKSFEDDLDLAAVLYISDEMRVAYAVSTTTDALYILTPEEFTQHYPTAHRFADGMDYEIYRVIETEEDEEE